MDNREFKSSLLKEKIKRFKIAVVEAADRLGVKQPVVKIWECPYDSYNPDEIAHCHHETGMICISERMLERRDFDELIETATHEVSHLLHPDHGHEFHRTHQNLREAAWRPPVGEGILAFSEADLSRPRPKRKPSKPDKKTCNYYQASYHGKGKLEQCEYCNRSFCKDHIAPRPFKITKLGDPNNPQENPHSHPCGSYLDSKKEPLFIGRSKGGCNYCGAHMQGMPHDCKFCKELFCDEHRLPEDHECHVLKSRKMRLSPDIVISMRSSSGKSRENSAKDEKGDGFSHLTRRHLDNRNFQENPRTTLSHKSSDSDEDYNKEMYRPSHKIFNFSFRNTFRNLFSFHLAYEIRNALTPFFITMAIGMVLDYVYYQNISLHYLFIQGVQDWFSILMSLINNGLSEGYDLFYLIINGVYYWYLYSYSLKLLSSIVRNLNRKGTILFLLGVSIAIFITFKYFPQIVY